MGRVREGVKGVGSEIECVREREIERGESGRERNEGERDVGMAKKNKHIERGTVECSVARASFS